MAIVINCKSKQINMQIHVPTTDYNNDDVDILFYKEFEEMMEELRLDWLENPHFVIMDSNAKVEKGNVWAWSNSFIRIDKP